MESGLYSPPPQPRIIFEGTLLDAQAFFEKTVPVENARRAPIAQYTDGLPINIPTEAAVAEMLTGTSHSPGEIIKNYSFDRDTGTYTQSENPREYSRAYTATVEKVAAIAVMAGGKPEYLPVILALAASGAPGSCPGTSGPRGNIVCISGPIAKEIGMNPGQQAMGIGNYPNRVLGRVGDLMTVCLGSCQPGLVRTDGGNPLNGVCFPEDDDGLPPGWETYREDKGGYPLTASALGKASVKSSSVQQYAPSSYRALMGDGTGGMAHRIGVEGTPGPHNFMEYIIPLYIPSEVSEPLTWVLAPNMAQGLYDYGFKTKKAFYDWAFSTYTISVGEYKTYGWWDFKGARTYGDLPDDARVPALGSRGDADDLTIIVAAGFADETAYTWSPGISRNLTPIDPWR
ncbi:hypothetical protein ACFLTL_01260 [Chloroflexota bacterium]